jgi:aryl-alcohol dehydrogenase-like predicted oxidoreductase
MSINKLTIGTAQFGLNYGIANKNGQVSLTEIEKILDFSQSSGINSLDTAIAYGASESRLGTVGIKNWDVISKLPAIPEECLNVKDWVVKSIEESLDRLRVTSLYGLLLHRPDQLFAPDGFKLYEALKFLKDAGMVQHLGISVYGPDELIKLSEYKDVEIVQSPFNIFDRRLMDDNLMNQLTGEGREIHVRSVFLQGLLLMESGDRPLKFLQWRKLWQDYDDFVLTCGLSKLQVCMKYVLSFDQIKNVIVGVDSVNQLKEICDAATGSFLELPEYLRSNDLLLINPASWQTLNH